MRRAERELRRRHRREGFSDGYAGRPAASTTADYQRAWRNGRAAKQRDNREG